MADDPVDSFIQVSIYVTDATNIHVKLFSILPKAGIEPASPRPQRGVLTTILLGPTVCLPQSAHVLTFQNWSLQAAIAWNRHTET
ncbi:hypothetical protein L596_026519 [Steinernema carpocapsae]|uniref:Uncharacterized protein n=1 Tax=Steinernema carpocapsae TaxID=34508 RepID=A0A4V5ZY75_STECR|nr:hypothetical protein L596_026519 [Steinernema carpocapsae]